MDKLFTAELHHQGSNQTYDVYFEHESYVFRQSNGGTSFHIKREDDEWHADGQLDGDLKDAAVQQLEGYLLSQH